MDKTRESETISILRSIAVLMIAGAHCVSLPQNVGNVAIAIVRVCESFCSYGVWIFFAIGGYLYAYDRKPWDSLISRKFKTIVMPWLFTGLAVYLWTALRHGNISFVSGLQFVFGYGSYLWYLSVFVVLLLVFYFSRKEKYLCLVPIAIGIIVELSRVMYQFYSGDYQMYYLICGAWVVSFGIGYAINKFKLQEKLLGDGGVFQRIGAPCLVVSVVLTVFISLKNGEIRYWNRLYIPLCILQTIGLLYFVFRVLMRLKAKKTLIALGNVSFLVYLLHMPVAGIVANIFCRFDHGYTVPFRSFIVVTICYIVSMMVNKFLTKYPKLKCIKMLIGLR